MNQYLHKALKRIPLHATAFCGAVATAGFVMWAKGVHHFYLIPAVEGVMFAFGKEALENVTISQVWIEFWVDSLAQAAGSLLGVFVLWLAVR